MKFLALPTIILLTFCSLTGCSSKKGACGCPYQSGIQREILPLNDFNFDMLLSADNTNWHILHAYPEKVLEDIKSLNPFKEENSFLSFEVIKEAFKYEGVRYRRGGLSKNGLDCSGLVFKCFSDLGISLPRTSIAMAKSVLDIGDDEVQVGDLIFFKTNRRRNVINHVGIVTRVKGKEIKFIHASINKGVIESSTSEQYYADRYVKVGRVLGT